MFVVMAAVGSWVQVSGFKNTREEAETDMRENLAAGNLSIGRDMMVGRGQGRVNINGAALRVFEIN